MKNKLWTFIMTICFSTVALAAGPLYDKMAAATARLEEYNAATTKPENSKQILQETWETLHSSSLSNEGQKASDEFLDHFFRLTDAYTKADNTGAAMDVFADYYDRKKKRVDAYVATGKTPADITKRVLDAANKYSTATDPGPGTPRDKAAPGGGSKGQP